MKERAPSTILMRFALCFLGAVAAAQQKDRLKLGDVLFQGQFVTALRDDDVVRLDAHWRADPVEGCDRDQPCFLELSPEGELAVHMGVSPEDAEARRLKVLSPPSPEMSSVRLVFQRDGKIVLYGAPYGAVSDDPEHAGERERVLWVAAGSALPPGCTAETECGSRAIVGIGVDGGLVMHRGTSDAMEAYLRVGLPAVQRLRGSLWHNDFQSSPTHSSAAPRVPWEVPGGPLQEGEECRVPPALGLITFPNSGTSFTLTAISEATNNTVYTAYERDVGCPTTGRLNDAQCQNLCGRHACRELGMCQLFADRMRSPPKAGKGAILKSHVHSYGTTVLCGTEHLQTFQEKMETGEYGAPLHHYAYLRLFRNPFDNLVARFHLLAGRNRLLGIGYSREGFLSNDGHFPRRDIYTMLSWHLFANIALARADRPTGLLDYESMYTEPQAYVRSVLSMLGWSEAEVPDEVIKRVLEPRLKTRDFPRFRGQLLPCYIDEWYSPEVIYHMAKVIHQYLDVSDGYTMPACVRPIIGPYDVAPPPP